MIYTSTSHMKRVVGGLFSAVLITFALAAQNSYQEGKIVDVQKRVNTRVLYYIVNTPVTRDDAFYEVQLQLQNTRYTAQYTPRRQEETFPDEYVPGSKVEAKVEKRHMFLKRPSGNDLDLVIVKRASAASQ